MKNRGINTISFTDKGILLNSAVTKSALKVNLAFNVSINATARKKRNILCSNKSNKIRSLFLLVCIINIVKSNRLKSMMLFKGDGYAT